MRSRTKLVLVIVAAAAIAMVGYSTLLLLGESVYSNRGSFAYWLTISPIIKGVPEFRPLESLRFYASAGDGPKLPESAVGYWSLAHPEELRHEVDRYLLAQGYRRREDGTYERGRSIVSVEVSPDGQGSEVNVRENY